jgi:hypothetical protein
VPGCVNGQCVVQQFFKLHCLSPCRPPAVGRAVPGFMLIARSVLAANCALLGVSCPGDCENIERLLQMKAAVATSQGG